MSDKNDSGDKTELPTPKRLQDARKKGDVAKSRDLTATVATLGWLILFLLLSGYTAGKIRDFTVQALAAGTNGTPFMTAVSDLGGQAVMLVALVVAMLMIPIAVLSTLTDSLQIGPIFTTEKLKMSFDKMNPVEGLKRMFGKDGLVELVKSLAKVIIVATITWMTLRSVLPDLGSLIALAGSSPVAGKGSEAAGLALDMTRGLLIRLLAWTVAAFIIVAALDWLWTRHSYIKKMMMSRRDIKQEFKSDEGDPHIKQHRKQMHQEFANNNAIESAGGAAALLVNPTHIAIALDYDREKCPVPVIAAKGQGPLAAAMRAEAERKGVPIVRSIPAARALWARGVIGDIVPEDMFDAVAEVILWAQKAKAGAAPMDQELGVARRSAAGAKPASGTQH